MTVLDLSPPNGLLTLSHWLSTRRHREMHYANTDEEMVGQVRQSTVGFDLNARLLDSAVHKRHRRVKAEK